MVYRESADLILDEMSIVNVFTKLIFDSQSNLEINEQVVLAILADIDPSLRNISRVDLSEYLRAMSVSEMTQTVEKIKQHLGYQQELIVSNPLSQQYFPPQ